MSQTKSKREREIEKLTDIIMQQIETFPVKRAKKALADLHKLALKCERRKSGDK